MLAGGLDPVDVVHRDRDHPPAVADEEVLHVPGAGAGAAEDRGHLPGLARVSAPAEADVLLRPADGVGEPGGVDRLEQVVEGVDLERPDRVLVVGRDEGDEWHRVLLQHSNDADAVEFRHLPIEQGEIRSLSFDDRDCVFSRCGLADDRDVFKRAEE